MIIKNFVYIKRLWKCKLTSNFISEVFAILVFFIFLMVLSAFDYYSNGTLFGQMEGW